MVTLNAGTSPAAKIFLENDKMGLAAVTPNFILPGFLGIILTVLGIIAIVWFANRVSRGSNQQRSNAPQPSPQATPEAKRPSPQPLAAQPKKSRFFGCLLALLGVGMIGLLLVVGVVAIFFVGYKVENQNTRRPQAIAQQIEFEDEFRSTQLEGQAEAQRQAIEQFEQIQSQLVLEGPVPASASSEILSRNGHEVYIQPGTKVMMSGLSLILLFALIPLTVLFVIMMIIRIATRASRKSRPVDGYDSNSGSDSMAYQAAPRPVAQKMGCMPWIIVGMVFTIGLGVAIFAIPFVMLEGRASVSTPNGHEFNLPHLQQNFGHVTTVAAMPGNLEPKPIDVPIDVPLEKPVEKPIKKPVDLSQTASSDPSPDKLDDGLDEELDGSGASLLIESILRAAMKSFQEDTPEEIAAKLNNVASGADAASKANGADPAVEVTTIEKPLSAVRSLTRALVTELPDGIDESTALKSLGRFLGRAIAAESETRPDWVDQASGVDPSTGLYRTVVTVGPYQTRMDCDRRLDDELRKTVDDYTELYLGPAARGRANLSRDQLNKLITRTCQESISTSVGPMINVHTELVFDSKTQASLQERFHESLVQDRIKWSSIALGCVSLFLLGAFAVLKFDPFYRRRILIVVGVSVVILLGLGILVIA